MQAQNFSLPAYLDRIAFRGEAKPDLPTLISLMRHQLRAVPFENLDVQAGKVVSLVPEHIVEKIVHRRRGGYCYEVNGIFSMALQALGIPHRYVAARPMFYPVRRPRTHMGIIATVEGVDWLCDLGFGSYGLRAPIRIDTLDVEVPQDHDTFMLGKSEVGEIVLKAKVEGEWTTQYGFDLSRQEWVDFAPANYMNSTHPEAIFVKQFVVVLHTEAGRKILSGDTFKVVEQGRTSKREIAPVDRAALLREQFGLVIAP
ncbi:MAG TPA: arylamine N-acetyltransferase [Burkholderiaceae bacterium]